MTPNIRRVAALHRVAAKVSGGAVRFLREAAAGAKPLIDADGMADALTALGWEVNESVVGIQIEGQASNETYKWLAKELDKVAGLEYKSWRKINNEVQPENVVWIEGGTMSVGYRGQTKGLSAYRIYGSKDGLERVKRHLARFSNVDKVGDIGVTINARGIQRETRRVRTQDRRVVDQETGRLYLHVKVWVTIRQWSVANTSLKGTKKKPVVLAQQLKGIKPLPPKGIKAGKLWNSLYMRGLKQEAADFLEAEGTELPSDEEIAEAEALQDSPQERVRRTFDHKVRKALEDFTGKQLKAVEEHFTELYQNDVDRFLDYQEQIFDLWHAEWIANDKPRQGHLRQFPPFGSPRHSWQRHKEVAPEVAEARGRGDTWKALASQATRFLEHDDARVKKLDLGYGVPVRLYKAPSNVRSKVEKAGKETARMIREAFIAKNTGKLSTIVTGKGNLDEINLQSWSKRSFEGELAITFTDGSHFIVRNKTVYKVSSRGTWFAQFPTTFHRVVFPDGTKMKGTASERRMVREFAGVTD